MFRSLPSQRGKLHGLYTESCCTAPFDSVGSRKWRSLLAATLTGQQVFLSLAAVQRRCLIGGGECFVMQPASLHL